MKVLHFAPDDKFVPFVQRSFEAVFPGCNEYRIPVVAQAPLRFVLPGAGVKAVDRHYWRSQQLATDLASADCLVINCMNSLFATAVAKAPPHVLVIWVGWGNDYYKFIQPFLGNFHLPRTAELVSRLTPRPPMHLRLLRLARRGIESPEHVLPYLANRRSPAFGKDKSIIDRIINRIDYVSVLEEEKPLFEKAFPGFHKHYHRIHLYSAEEVFSVGPERMCGPDILLGNSANPTNNHLELFEALQSVDLTGRRLIVPLNYGSKAIYGDEIARIGRDRFGDAFVPLRQFLPLDEYYNCIAKCGTVLMNHVRQQGGTTVATALYKGAKAFMRNESPLLSFYRKLGMRVWSIQDEWEEAARPFEAPSDAARANNRQVLESHWGHEAALAAIRALEELVTKKCAAGDARSTVQVTP